jgi:SAM-dependent methyltransferase
MPSNDDTSSSAAIAESYEAVAYEAKPNTVSHPDHLAAIATMFGLEAPDVGHARVLEIGCSDGANLLPVAATLPDSRSVGCDLSPTPIRLAREATAALNLSNVEWFACDFRELPAGRGPFDYIIAHGVYSWVSAPVRDALVALAARTLSLNGVMFVSYSVFPGAHTRRAVSEMLRHHTANLAAIRDKLAAARELAALLAEAGTTHDAADAAIQVELRRIADLTDGMLAHDVIAKPNDPVYFYEFAAHASRHGLAYLAEAAPAMMAGAGLGANMRAYLSRLDRLAREQYLDFARLRRFRQSLLCRADAPTDFALKPSRMAALFATASMPLLQAANEGRLPGGTGDLQASVHRSIFERLVAAAPTTVPVAALAEGTGSPVGVGSTPSAEAAILQTWMSGFVQLRTKPLPAMPTASIRPEAFALARWQASTRESVTNLRHESIRLTDPLARTLLTLLDGAHNRDEMVSALAAGSAFGDTSAVAMRVDDTLASFARSGLLIR